MLTSTSAQHLDLASHHRSGAASIRFDRSPDGKTYVSSQRVAYPFHVTRAFYMQGDPDGMPSMYLQSLSGGMFAHDNLRLSLAAGQGAVAHVTTQSSTLVHRSADGDAVQSIDLSAEAGAVLEYLPDSMVLFPGAALDTRVRIRCPSGATVMLSDIFYCHDPFERGRGIRRLKAELRVERPDGALVCLERFEIGAERLSAGGRLGAHGTFVCISGNLSESLLGRLRAALATVPETYSGVSELPNGAGIKMRALADDGCALRTAIGLVWRELRTDLFGLAPRARPK